MVQSAEVAYKGVNPSYGRDAQSTQGLKPQPQLSLSPSNSTQKFYELQPTNLREGVILVNFIANLDRYMVPRSLIKL